MTLDLSDLIGKRVRVTLSDNLHIDTEDYEGVLRAVEVVEPPLPPEPAEGDFVLIGGEPFRRLHGTWRYLGNALGGPRPRTWAEIHAVATREGKTVVRLVPEAAPDHRPECAKCGSREGDIVYIGRATGHRHAYGACDTKGYL